MSEQVNETPEATEVVEAEESEVGTPEVEAEETEEAENDAESFDSQRALAKIAKLNSENKNLRAAKKAAEAKTADIGDKAQRAEALEAENLRLRVAVKHGLPESLVKRLSGSTEEEMLQDAEELIKLFGSKAPPSNLPKERLRGGGDPTVEPDGLDDPDKFAERMFRN